MGVTQMVFFTVLRELWNVVVKEKTLTYDCVDKDDTFEY